MKCQMHVRPPAAKIHTDWRDTTSSTQGGYFAPAPAAPASRAPSRATTKCIGSRELPPAAAPGFPRPMGVGTNEASAFPIGQLDRGGP